MLSEPSSSSTTTTSQDTTNNKSTRLLHQQQQPYYHYHSSVNSSSRRRFSDIEKHDHIQEEDEHERIRQRSRRRINKERIEHDMNLLYTCSRQVSESLTSNVKHDQIPHFDALIDTTKRMLQTLGDAREQWLEQQQQELQQQPLKISTTTLNNNKNMSRYSSTSPKSKSTQQRTTTTTINHPSSPSPPAPTSKTISQQQSKRSREQSIDIPKQCHSCQSAETPEWRKGPMGPRTLCNACGLIWAKLARQQGIPEGPDEEPSTTNVDDNHEANKYALSYLLS